ncbi:hypothetical protein VC83_00946 [Pseudogymnoascus destructans]|uniref:SWIM-type domain-containing protein n=2 Tax=Pseudogymnoascus destructans TaxID=655981 RepID=L8FLF3_PSED2|nr:uncharacterized protein VC83_00946 [Pseudogymnoascus destructans]ELR01715.1 hypothetical protein GMDG_00091 [Pseudogymnoascus destructans 20631-21]OAF62543.1 hypothetical protein VC83_00946 [Pseudogymnoascus destructans]
MTTARVNAVRPACELIYNPSTTTPPIPLPLPTPHALLTALLSLPPSTTRPSTPNPTPNPLVHAPAPIRTLLTTLHILLPTLLLPALDLLDRALLTRITTPPHLPEPSATSATASSTEATGSMPAAAPSQSQRKQVYLVRSSQTTGARGAVGGRVYIVRLGAWNCSCAAFAFSAFPGAASSLVFDAEEEEEEVDVDVDGGHGGGGGEWQFGGVSRDGLGGGVPCCKHILACVLAERMEGWVGVVKEREVGREEMAGLGCEG